MSKFIVRAWTGKGCDANQVQVDAQDVLQAALSFVKTTHAQVPVMVAVQEEDGHIRSVEVWEQFDPFCNDMGLLTRCRPAVLNIAADIREMEARGESKQAFERDGVRFELQVFVWVADVIIANTSLFYRTYAVKQAVGE